MNLLLLHADQHRWDCLGAYGNSHVRTPNIDALAAEAARYDNSFCAFPVCTPSRYSLLSGQWVHEHAGNTNHCTLHRDRPSFPRVLQQAGWRTAAVGKMHFTPTYLDVGFDRMVLAEQDGPGRWDDDYHRYLRDRDLVDAFDLTDQRQEYRKSAPPEYWRTFGAMASDLDEAHHSTTWIGDRAMEQLAGWDTESRQMLMVGFIKPHHPFDPPGRWAEMYDPDTIDLPPGWCEACLPRDLALHAGYFPHAELTHAAARRACAMYYAIISQIDHQIGRMLDLLRRRGLYDDTMIVYTSDHGEYMGFHHLLLKGGYMYDPLVKVPLIVKYPHSRAAAGVSDALVSNVDVSATVLGCAGLDVPGDLRGIDLLARPRGREIVFAESGRGRQVMARTRTHKLLWCDSQAEDALLDLRNDPLEMHNVIDDPAHAGELAELRRAAEDWLGPAGWPETYLDESAPRLAADNVPPLDDEHRRQMIEYCQCRMRDARLQ